MRVIFSAILCLVTITSFARPDLPDNIRYHEADEKLNRDVRQRLVKAFNTQNYQHVFGGKVVCGPALWARIKGRPELNNLKMADANFNIPITSGPNAGKFQVLKGSLFQTPDEIRALSDIFATLPAGLAKVRKINSHEAKNYWALIPYDIEEPIYIVEYGNLRFLVDVDKKSRKIFWIDEISKYRKN